VSPLAETSENKLAFVMPAPSWETLQIVVDRRKPRSLYRRRSPQLPLQMPCSATFGATARYKANSAIVSAAAASVARVLVGFCASRRRSLLQALSAVDLGEIAIEAP
jgi:hypothetical protein